MPTNSEGEEVNQDGSPITDEQKETHDWTDVITLRDKSKVKPYSIEELATTSVPHTIPYLEVYRTNEVMYRPYKSPYLTEISTDGSSDGSSSSEDSGDGGGSSSSSVWTALSKILSDYYPASKDKNGWIQKLRDANSDWTSIAKVVNQMGGDSKKQNNVISAVLNAKKNSSTSSNSPRYSSKNKNAKLKNELMSVVKNNFKKKANYNTLVNRYMEAKTNKDSISSVTNHSSVWLKSSVSPSTVNNAVYNIKHKYS